MKMLHLDIERELIPFGNDRKKSNGVWNHTYVRVATSISIQTSFSYSDVEQLVSKAGVVQTWQASRLLERLEL